MGDNEKQGLGGWFLLFGRGYGNILVVVVVRIHMIFWMWPKEFQSSIRDGKNKWKV